MAVKAHRLDILQHQVAHHGVSTWDLNDAVELAFSQGAPPAMLQWLEDQGCVFLNHQPHIPILNRAFGAGACKPTIKWLVDKGRVKLDLGELIETRRNFPHTAQGLKNLVKVIPHEEDLAEGSKTDSGELWWKETFSKIELQYLGRPMSTDSWRQVLFALFCKYGRWQWGHNELESVLDELSALGLTPTPSQSSPFRKVESLVQRRSQRIAAAKEDRSFECVPALLLCSTKWPILYGAPKFHPACQWACWMRRNGFPFRLPPGTKGETNFTHHLIATQGREEPSATASLFQLKILDLDATDRFGNTILDIVNSDATLQPIADMIGRIQADQLDATM